MYRSGHMTRSYVQIRTDDWWPYCTDFVCMCELHWHVCMRAMSACTTGQFIQRAMLISNWILDIGIQLESNLELESNWNPIWNWNPIGIQFQIGDSVGLGTFFYETNEACQFGIGISKRHSNWK